MPRYFSEVFTIQIGVLVDAVTSKSFLYELQEHSGEEPRLVEIRVHGSEGGWNKPHLYSCPDIFLKSHFLQKYGADDTIFNTLL